VTTDPDKGDTRPLTRGEVLQVANKYIGGTGGYLGIEGDGHEGSFSRYSMLSEFFPEYCGIDVDVYIREGTIRDRFITITQELMPRDQAKVLRGVLKRFPATDQTPNRKEQSAAVSTLIRRLEGVDLIDGGDLKQSSEAVRTALRDADTLLATGTPARAVDRVHTALHAYLKTACKNDGIAVKDDANTQELIKILEQQHPKFADIGPRSESVKTILRSLGTIANQLNFIRNKSTAVHPTDEMLDEPEAWLAINSCRIILFYLDKKLAE